MSGPPQMWRCPKCERTYVAAIPVLFGQCNNKHGSAGASMVLVEGTLPEKRIPRRKK